LLARGNLVEGARVEEPAERAGRANVKAGKGGDVGAWTKIGHQRADLL